MKKKFTLVLSMLLMVGLVYDYNFRMAHTNSSGANPGNTGSPGDGQTCFTGCHGGNPGSGIGTEATAINSDIPGSGYVPGTVYNISVEMTGGGSSFGFSLSAQNASGTNLGTLIAGTGSQLNGNGDYVTHSAGSSSGSGSRTWSFQWEAPISGSGPVTFYTATIFGNGFAGNSGDFLVLAQSSTTESTVGISEAQLEALSVYPNPIIDEIHVAAKDVDEEIMVTMFDVQGRKVLEEKHDGGANIKVDVKSRSLNTGVYFLRIEVDGKSTIKKLLVQ